MNLSAYSAVKKVFRLVSDPKYRNRQYELRRDLEMTRRQVEAWARQGSEFGDPNHRFAILSFTNLPMHAKFHCLAAKSMQLRGFTPLIFTTTKHRFGHSYYRLFGISCLEMWDQYLDSWGLSDEDLEETISSLLAPQISVSWAKNLIFHDVHVGEHALSMTCRKRIEGRLNLQDPQTFTLFRSQLKSAVQNVITAEKYLDKNPVGKMLIRDAGYIPSGPIYEAALNRGVDCVVLEFGQRRSTWIFKRYLPATRGQHYFSLSSSAWEKIKQSPWTAEQEKQLEREFSGRYQPNSMDDTRRLQSGKQILSPEEVRSRLGLDPCKKTAVIFSHVAWDAAFFFGTCLFDDFEDWLYQTVKFVSENCPDVNWIIKEHPFNVFKLQRESVAVSSEQRLLRPLMPLPPHVHFVPADTEINTRSLFSLVDCVLTVNGTVGMEFPCFGIPAVVAGTGRYNGYGFTIEPQSKTEYFQVLQNISQIERLPEETRLLARKHFHTLIIGKQISFEDVAPMELKRLHEAQSDVHDNIHFTPRSLKEFREAHSVNLLGDWLAHSTAPDLIEL